MRTAFFSVLALASSFVSVIAAPVESASLVKRADPTDIINSLTTTVEGFDAQISMLPTLQTPIQGDEHFTDPFSLLDSTLATISPDSSPDDIAAASATIQGYVNSIIDAVNAATAEVPTLPAMLKARQAGATDPTALGELIEQLLVEISNTANAVIAGLGLSKSLVCFVTKVFLLMDCSFCSRHFCSSWPCP